MEGGEEGSNFKANFRESFNGGMGYVVFLHDKDSYLEAIECVGENQGLDCNMEYYYFDL